MRIFKYWAEQTVSLRVEDEEQKSRAFGGSDISLEEAEKDALVRLAKAQQRIYGQKITDDYEANIVEEIIERIDENNIITRNRYGALVLNSANQMFIDVDVRNPGLFTRLFDKKMTPKEYTLQKIRKKVKKNNYRNYGFVIYETHNGYRVIVTGNLQGPRTKKSIAVMRDIGTDFLYFHLCLKQNCFRARLTPKPYRIKQRRLSSKYLNRNEEQQSDFEAWVEEYDRKSISFAVCKKIEQHGEVSHNPIIQYHEKSCKVNSTKKLA